MLAFSFDPGRIPPHKGELCAGNIEAVRRQQLVNQAIWRSIGEFDYRAAVGVVKAPVLVIHGVADSIPQQGSEDWAKSFPNARLLLIQRTGHLAHLEQPDIFFTAVDQFLAVAGRPLLGNARPIAAAANNRARCPPPERTE